MTDHTPGAQATKQEAVLTDDQIERIRIRAEKDSRRFGRTVDIPIRADLLLGLLSKLRAPVADGAAHAAIKAVPSTIWWHPDGYTVNNNFNGEDLILRSAALEALASAPVAREAQPVPIPSQRPSGVLSMDGASLHMQRDGSGRIIVAEDDFTLEDDRGEGPDGPQGSVHWVARLPASELIALRDFLTGHARPSDDALWSQTLAERDEYHDMADKLANAIADHLLVEIGEHSSSNCPWMRALEAIENAAPQASEAAAELPAPVNGEARAWSFAAPGPVAAEVRDAALEEAAQALEKRAAESQNEYDHRKEPYFEGSADAYDVGAFVVRSLKSQRAALSAQPGAQKEQSDA